MLSSSNSGKRTVDRVVIRLVKQLSAIFKPTNLESSEKLTVLDLGIGSGYFSSRYKGTWLKDYAWIGVEFEDLSTRTFTDSTSLSKTYDVVINQDVLNADDYWFTSDICFIDLLERLDKSSALSLIEKAVNKSKVVILSTHLNGEVDNVKVKSSWTLGDFTDHPNLCFYNYNDNDVGVVVLSKTHKSLIADVLKPQIGVYTICKNESAFIERMYRSVDQADFVVICDTGSTDNTVSILERLVHERTELHGHEEEFNVNGQSGTATDGSLLVQRIFVSPWRFDDAKNCALMLLPEEIDVCVSLDADEVMEPGWYERLSSIIKTDIIETGSVKDRYYHRFKTVWDWMEGGSNTVSEHWHERIHSRHGYYWKLPVHEILYKFDGSSEGASWINDLYMLQLPDVKKPRSSYFDLLQISVKEDPSIWKSWSFLATEYIARKDFIKAIECIDNALEIQGSDKAFLNYQAALVYKQIGQHTNAFDRLYNAVRFAPNVREYKVYLAQALSEHKQYNEALMMINEAEKITQQTSGYEFNDKCWGENFTFIKQTIESAK